MKSLLSILLLLISVPLTAAALAAAAQVPDSVVDVETRLLASEIRCPVCRGVSVEESPSDFAREMKSIIREKVIAGESRHEIRRYFGDRYGDWVLLDPERQGIMLSLWVMPLLAVGLGGILLALKARRWLQLGVGERPVLAGAVTTHSPNGEED